MSLPSIPRGRGSQVPPPPGLQYRAALWAGSSRFLLSTLPWRWTLALLQRGTRRTRTPRRSDADPYAVAGAMAQVPRFVPRATCLVQAMTAALLMTRAGRRVELVMGTPRVRAGAFEAHAWLEHDGAVVVGGDISQHAELVRIPLGTGAPPAGTARSQANRPTPA